MLNRAARYFSLMEELKGYLGGQHQILEIGSGSLGMSEFYAHPFVGCDIGFETKPRDPMIPVIASATQLPFPAKSFDVVICSDVMEHVPPGQRGEVTAEVFRVARKKAVFCFPCGPQAFALDEKLFLDYEARGMKPPVWLQEHMRHPFPDRDLFRRLPDGWRVKCKPNESLTFHDWMMRKEMLRIWDCAFRAVLLVMPAVVREILRGFDREPSYRMVFTFTSEGRTT